VVSRFVYGTRANVPAYMTKGGTTYRLITDHLGSVRLVVNATDGTVAQRIDYDEFGRITQNTAPGFQPFGYAGGLLDDHTGLTRFGARDYDAAPGRWTAKEPLGFSGGYANLYAYVGSDPVNFIDPSGSSPEGCGDVPKAPPGVKIDNNIKEAQKFLDPSRYLGDWNYKKLGRPATETESAEYEDFGNFNYGATMAAAGYDEETALRIAGLVQIASKTSKPEYNVPWGKPPYGDQQGDYDQIRKGYRYYECKFGGTRWF